MVTDPVEDHTTITADARKVALIVKEVTQILIDLEATNGEAALALGFALCANKELNDAPTVEVAE